MPAFRFTSRAVPSEARSSFQTFFHYIRNIAMKLESEYGRDPTERYSRVHGAALQTDARINRRQISDSVRRRVERQYRSALSNLVCLHREANSDDFYEEKNAWTPAQAWYAIHHCYGSLGTALNPSGRRDHARTCAEAGQLAAIRRALPYPWSLHVVSTYDTRPSHTFRGFQTAPDSGVSALRSPSDETFEDLFAKMLETTANRRAKTTLAARPRGIPAPGRTRRNVPAAVKRQVFEGLGPTTVFDVLYRLRVRANYGDIDTFVVGCRSPHEARLFAAALEVVTDASLAVIEATLDRYVGAGTRKGVIDAMARRPGATDTVLRRAALLAR